ncbi:unnamed protein product [Rhizopus stolonifer]
MRFKSPYFNESHTNFRKAVRIIYDEIRPEVVIAGEIRSYLSKEIYQRLGEEGIIAFQISPGPWLKGLKPPAGIQLENFDYFYELITYQEIARLGTPSFNDGISSGYSIDLLPIFNSGSPELKARVVSEALLGKKKRICLTITVSYTGSDVARIRTTAKRTPDGKHFVINRVKKWIISLWLLSLTRVSPCSSVEHNDNMETKQIKTSYGACIGTSYITFDNVKVSAENTLGKEGKSFQVILYNFNGSHWYICGAVAGGVRMIIEDCYKWTVQHKIFGKRLIDQPVIRNKLAAMVAQLELIENWIENITFQMCNMSYVVQAVKLADPIALLKYQCTRVAHNVSDEACQIFGGRDITKTSMGRNMLYF